MAGSSPGEVGWRSPWLHAASPRWSPQRRRRRRSRGRVRPGCGGGRGQPATRRRCRRRAPLPHGAGRGWLLLGTIERIEGRLPQARDGLPRRHGGIGGPARASARSPPPTCRWARPRTRRRYRAAGGGRPGRPADARPAGAGAAGPGRAGATAAGRPRGGSPPRPADLELAFALARAYLARGNRSRRRPLRAHRRARPIPQTHLLDRRGRRRDTGERRARAGAARGARSGSAGAPRALLPRACVALESRVGGRAGGGDRGVPGRAASRTRRSRWRASSWASPWSRTSASRRRCRCSEGAARSGGPQPAHARLSRARPARARPPGRGRGVAGARAGHGPVAGRERGPRCGPSTLQLGQALQAARPDRGGGRATSRSRSGCPRRARTPSASSSPVTWPTRPTPEAAHVRLAGASRTSLLAACRPRSGRELQARVTAALARAYLNLGVLQAQRQRFARAAELLREGGHARPGVPAGAVVARRRLLQRPAVRAGDRALERVRWPEQPHEARLRGCWRWPGSTASEFAKAAELLRDDPERPEQSRPAVRLRPRPRRRRARRGGGAGLLPPARHARRLRRS